MEPPSLQIRRKPVAGSPAFPPRPIRDSPPPYSEIQPHDAHFLPPKTVHVQHVVQEIQEVTKNQDKPFWQTALDETRFFAGGLLSRPIESTKHHSILRHSSALVLYHGPTTCVVISIFSAPNHPLPPRRTLWLQQRGFSGDTGMKLKALLGTTASWLDVTPDVQALPADVEATAERGWQRDLTKAVKGGLSHVARETHAVRIPAVAADGYYRLVLCAGKKADGTPGKTLCSSPAFRLASASSDSSIFRGAKLTTVPLEVGVKIASTIASKTVHTYTGPITGAVQNRVQKLQPGLIARHAGHIAYAHSSLERKWASTGDLRQKAGMNYKPDGGVRDLNKDEGPHSPFPLDMKGKVIKGVDCAKLDTRSAGVMDIPGDLGFQLRGVYFGWVTLLNGQAAEWRMAVLVAAPSATLKTSVVAQSQLSIYLLDDPNACLSVDQKTWVMVMGSLRSSPGITQRYSQHEFSQDVKVVCELLCHANWEPQLALDTMAQESDTILHKLADARQKVQTQLDKIPLHLVGVRTMSAESRDEMHGNGGYWICRSDPA